MYTAEVIMVGMLRISVVLCGAALIFRLLDIADKYWNGEDDK